MKILQQGNCIINCSRCNSVLRYEKADLKEDIIYIPNPLLTMPPKKMITTYIKCPVCNNKIEI